MIDGQGTIELENDSTFSLQRSGKGIILHCDSFNTDILIPNIEQDMQQVKICDTQLPLNQLLTELDSNNNYLELTVGKGLLLSDIEQDIPQARSILPLNQLLTERNSIALFIIVRKVYRKAESTA